MALGLTFSLGFVLITVIALALRREAVRLDPRLRRVEDKHYYTFMAAMAAAAALAIAASSMMWGA